jgi:hypothetical protein
MACFGKVKGMHMRGKFKCQKMILIKFLKSLKQFSTKEFHYIRIYVKKLNYKLTWFWHRWR